MAITTITYLTSADAPRGWQFLWAKIVTGADLSKHCAKCLKGRYLREFGRDMEVRHPISVEMPENSFLYLCGVARPHRWANNLHGAMRAGDGHVEIRAYNGDVIRVDGVEPVTFDDTAARRMFPERGEDFLTCRNFQFAVHQFGG